MTIENQADIDGIMAAGRVVAMVRDKMLSAIEPGMTTQELDALGGRLLEQAGAESAPRLVYDFPGATCISVNEEAAHGVPGSRAIVAGDIVNVDVSAKLNGYFADTGGTTVVPPVSPLKARLCRATSVALGHAIAEHGIGRSLHEAPEGIIGYYDHNDLRRLHAGQVIAIEPFLSTKSTHVHEGEDGWTLVGHRSNLSAQFEHTVIITNGEPIVATLSAACG